MSTETRDAFDSAFVDGQPPSKQQAREIGTVIDAQFNEVRASLASVGEAVLVGDARLASTRSILYADRAHDAGTIGLVYADTTASYNGYYLKSGARGSGSWSKITALTLPAEIIDRVTALEATAASLGDLAVLDQVDTAQIVNGAVTTIKIAADAVTTSKMADKAVTYAKMQYVTAGRILGRRPGTAGIVQEIAPADARADLGVPSTTETAEAIADAVGAEATARSALIASVISGDALHVIDKARVLLARLGLDGVLRLMAAGAAFETDDGVSLSGAGLTIPGASLVPGDRLDGVSILDKDGRWYGTLRATETLLPGMTIRWRPDIPDGPYMTDRRGYVWPIGSGSTDDGAEEAAEADLRIYFSDTLVGVEGVPLVIYPQQLIADRTIPVVVTLSMDDTADMVTGRDEIRLAMDVTGSADPVTALLTLRPTDRAPDRVATLPLSLICVPQPIVSAPSPKILIIGDSITDGAARYIETGLASLGMTATWVGTMMAKDVSGGNSGPLGESRSGWEAGDYTNAVNDRSSPLASGDEATYLAMDKDSQRDINPFIRPAAIGDAAQDIYNGYIIDFTFYQSRFGLSTPDIVIYGCGTNDSRERSAADAYTQVLTADALIYRRLAAAWPAARILRIQPGVGRAAGQAREDGDLIWRTKTTSVIRAIRTAIAGTGRQIPLVPLWALVSAEASYRLTTAEAETDTTLGTTVTPIYDPIHPQGSANIVLGRVVAGYVAAMALDLI